MMKPAASLLVRRFLDVAPVVLTLLAFAPVPAAGDEQSLFAETDGVRLVGSLEAGYDSFEERYSILDADTLDSVSEFRSRFSVGLASGTFLRDYFLLEGRGLVGDGNYEGAGRLRFSRMFHERRNRFTFETDFTRRTFTDASSFAFPNNYSRLYMRSQLRVATGTSSHLRLTGRLEDIDFDDRTEFDYDYTKGTVTAASEFEWGLTTFLSAGLRGARMAIPDSSEIEYDAWGPVLEVRTTPEIRKQAYLQTSLERRNYGAANAMRSSFWSLFAVLGAEWPIGDRYSLELVSDLENYHYDNATNVYFNYTEARNALLFNYFQSWHSQVGIGPTASFLTSGDSPDDEYTEFGARVHVEYSRGTRAWVSASYEIGKRDYRAFDKDTATPTSTAIDFESASVFSDYSYQRVAFFGNLQLREGLSANALIDYQPEDHDRQGDDATATLLSVGLSYNF